MKSPRSGTMRYEAVQSKATNQWAVKDHESNQFVSPTYTAEFAAREACRVLNRKVRLANRGRVLKGDRP